MSWSATEIILLLGTLGTSYRWYAERKDARSALATAKAEVDKAVTTLKEAVVQLEAEITSLKADHQTEVSDLKAEHQSEREAWATERGLYLERINHLESRLDRQGGGS